MLRTVIIFIWIGLVTTLISCNTNNSNSASNDDDTIAIDSSNLSFQYYNKIFLDQSEDIFRNVNFDEDIATVKAAEENSNLTLAESTPDYLQFEKDLYTDTSKGIDYAMLKYIFDNEDRLWIITVNYYIADSSRTNELFDLLNKNFSDQYGDYYIDSDGYTVWESSYLREDSSEVVYDLGIRKLIKFQDPGIQIELMRFGTL